MEGADLPVAARSLRNGRSEHDDGLTIFHRVRDVRVLALPMPEENAASGKMTG